VRTPGFRPDTSLYAAVQQSCRYRRLAELTEQGKIIALNFPIAMNPGLARALGTMLKQDFQRAVLKTYSLAMEYVFQPKAFSELQNAQAIVLPYDGFNPQPPTRCYLKPYYLDPQIS
jgi:hypothetical protein